MAISFERFEDLEKILPDQLRVSGPKLKLLVICVILTLIITCVILGVNLGLHAEGVMGPCAASGSIPTSPCTTTECLETAARLSENMDTSVDPCENFHHYACGGWSKRHTVAPDDGGLTVKQKIRKENDEKVRELVEKPILRNTPNSSERKLKEFFKMCLHDYGRMKEGGKHVIELVKQHLKGWYGLDPDNWQSSGWNVNDVISTIQGDLNVDVMLRLSVGYDYRTKKPMIRISRGGMGMYYRYYQRGDKAALREAYKKWMRKVGELLIRDGNVTLNSTELNQRLDQFVSDAYGQEEHLAQIVQDVRTYRPSLYRYRKMTIQQLENDYSQLPWRHIVRSAYEGFEVNNGTAVGVYPIGYFMEVNELLRNESTEKDRIMNNYIVWQLAQDYSRYLSWEYKYASSRYYEVAYGRFEFPPAWKECLNFVRYRLGSALAAEFLRKHASAKAKGQVESMFTHLQVALRNSVDRLKWMDNATKSKAELKVDSINRTIAYPDSYFNMTYLDTLHAKLVINKTDGFFKSLLNVLRFQRMMRSEELKSGTNYRIWRYVLWRGSGSAVPYYSWWSNNLEVPPGSMQFPLFGLKSPFFMNFGGLGSLMADEMTGSINHRGRYLWTNGTWTNWWTEETGDSYRKSTKCFTDAYDGMKAGPFLIKGRNVTVTIRGRYQSKRAIDVVAGVRTALKAYHDWATEFGPEQMPVGIPMSPDQAFFLSTAQTQCFVRTDEQAYYYARYQYIPEDILFNVALSHMTEFGKAFQCKANSKMVANGTCNVF